MRWTRSHPVLGLALLAVGLLGLAGALIGLIDGPLWLLLLSLPLLATPLVAALLTPVPSHDRWQRIDVAAMLLLPLVAVGLSTFFSDWIGVEAPYWYAIIVIAPYAVYAAARLRREYHLATEPGVCEKCGYDRSGLSRYAPCPECGHHWSQKSL